ncbi:MAG TPA: cyclic nucleotide-binding domain-containing protein [Thermodesulfovibrionia bacterium]|nr:cyclic nucleotide-binding domain-containing protein [Thermodesulfovibrionia bacterium]
MVTPEELSQFSIFQDLTDGEKQIVARYLKRKEFETGEKVFSYGEDGGKLYLVADGELVVTRMVEEGKEHKLGLLQKHQYFGGISVIDGGKHSATVKTTRETFLLTLTKANLDAIAKENPVLGSKLLLHMIHSLANFLRAMDEKFIEAVKFLTSGSEKRGGL